VTTVREGVRAAVRRQIKDVRARLAGVVIPRPFSIEAFRAQLAHDRGRPLHLHVLPTPSGEGEACGMWLATADADHVFHARGTSPMHELNIILHEIGHMLCDHVGYGPPETPSPLFSLLDPAMVQRVLMRTRYSTPEEEAAELMAALILEQVGWPRPSTGLRGPTGELHDLL
jgi:hypothetical protein